MTQDSIKKAVDEAVEFIERANVVLASPGIVFGRETGALRRQSMELTRALAEMRKP